MLQAAAIGVVLTPADVPAAERDPGLAEAVLGAVSAVVLVDGPVAHHDDVTALTLTFATAVPRLPGPSEPERGPLAERLARSAGGPARPSTVGER